jgi:hypothetical protein
MLITVEVVLSIAMTDAQLIALVKFLVRLQAENLAMRKVLVRGGGTGSAEIEAMIVEQRQALERLPVVASALQRNDLSTLQVLLDTLSTTHPA